MATLEEIQEQLKKKKAYCRELKNELTKLHKTHEELKMHNTFLIDRLDDVMEKNQQLRQEKMNMTVDDIIAMQKAKAEYDLKGKSFTETLEVQEENVSKMKEGI